MGEIIRDGVIVAFGAVVATWCVDCILLLLGYP